MPGENASMSVRMPQRRYPAIMAYIQRRPIPSVFLLQRTNVSVLLLRPRLSSSFIHSVSALLVCRLGVTVRAAVRWPDFARSSTAVASLVLDVVSLRRVAHVFRWRRPLAATLPWRARCRDLTVEGVRATALFHTRHGWAVESRDFAIERLLPAALVA